MIRRYLLPLFVFFILVSSVNAAIYLNEIMPDPSSGGDWVELYNSGGSPVDLTGWSLNDSTSNIADITGSIGTNGFLVFTVGNRLSKSGDSVKLLDDNSNIVDSYIYSSSLKDISFGRDPDGTGSFKVLSSPTKGDFNRNYAPVINPLSDLTKNEGENIDLTVSAADINGDSIKLFASGDALSYGGKFTDNGDGTGRFTMSTDNDLVVHPSVSKDMALTIIATDGSNSAEESITISITDINRAPSFSDIPAQKINEDESKSLDLDNYISDADGDSIRFSIVDDPDSICSINGKNLDISPAKDWSGVSSCTIKADDGFSGSDQKIISLEVDAVNDAPVISTLPEVSFDEDSSTDLDISPYVSDADNSNSQISVSKIGDPNIMITDKGNLLLGISPAKDWCGKSAVILRVSDGVDSTDAPLTLDVDCRNDDPTILLKSPADRSVIRSPSADLIWEGADVDAGDILTYTLYLTEGTGSADKIDMNSGESYTISNLKDNTAYKWKVEVDDGSSKVSSTEYTFTADINNAPIIDSFSPNSASVSMDEGSSRTFSVSASDPDSDTLSYKWKVNNADAGESSSYTYSPTFDDAGSHIITVDVSDSSGQITSNMWKVIVNNVNRAPVIADIPDLILNEDFNEYELDLSDYGSDPDGNSLNWKLVDYTKGIVNASISGDRLVLSSISNANGNIDITLNLSDSDLSAGSKFKIIINPVDDPIIINSTSPSEGSIYIADNVSKTFSLSIDDADNTGYTVEWFKDGVKAGSGDTFNFVSESSGAHSLEARVKDNEGNNESANWRYTISNIPIAVSFNGANTTNFEGMNDSNLSSVDLVLENDHGKIEFSNPVDLRDAADLDNHIYIGKDTISVDSYYYPQLNAPAIITFYNTSLNNIAVLRSSGFVKSLTDQSLGLCSLDICSIIYNSGGIVKVSVGSFSSYALAENIPPEADLPLIVDMSPDNSEEGDIVYGKFTVKNKGNYNPLDSLLISGEGVFSTAKFSSDNITFSDTLLLSLAPAEEKEVYVRYTIPSGRFGGGSSTIRGIRAASGNINRFININLDLKSKLEISSLKINGDRVSDGDRVRIDANDDLDIKARVKNLLSDNDMNNVKIRAVIDDINVDEESDYIDISPNRDESISLKVNLDENDLLDKHFLDIIIEGEDNNGFIHRSIWTIELDIRRKNKESRVDLTIIPNEVSCDKRVNLNIKVNNLGSSDMDDAGVEITTSYSYDDKADLGKIYSGDYKRYSTDLDLSNMSDGSYTVTVYSLRDGKREDSGGGSITVKKCSRSDKSDNIVGGGLKELNEEILKRITYNPSSSPVENMNVKDFRDSEGYITLLAVLMILTVGSLIFLGGAILIKYRR